jgi:hypothetical protein
LADFSGGMAAVMAQSDVRRAFRERDIGNASTGSARILTDAVDSLSDNLKETRTAWNNITNLFGAAMAKAAEPFAKALDALAEKLNKALEASGNAARVEGGDMGQWLLDLKKEADRTNFERPWFQ